MIDQTISHYKILEKLGEGGMGVVYKAQDLTLNRFVALKFLPDGSAASGSDAPRFLQEARAAAALNHPNICTIYGIEDVDGKQFIVMEYVDGQTLHDKRGSLSLKQAIEIGIQIAEGLAAAHEKGIIHRDIKPENIMIRKDGIAQIMDFGLAKLRGVTRLTKEGSTLGTAGYMSPEQVQGHEADHRSDIFSLGVLLFEMITGQLPFKGLHETAVAYEIVNVDSPPPSAINPAIPPDLDAVVLDCLEKDPGERTQSASQVALELKRYRRETSRQRASRITAARPLTAASTQRSAIAEPVMTLEPPAERTSRKYLILFAGGVILALIAGFAGAHILLSSPPPALMVRCSLESPEGVRFNNNDGGHSVISPDGVLLAFVGTDSTTHNDLYVRPMSSTKATKLSGTEGAEYPFWSPDSKSLGFFTGGKLKRIDVSGSPPLTLADAPQGRGGAWSSQGVIVFAPDVQTKDFFIVSASGGTAKALTNTDSTAGVAPRFPSFLPDGKHFLYATLKVNANNTITREDFLACVGGIDGSVVSLPLKGASNMYFSLGTLIYLRQGTLIGQRFDPESHEFTGEPVPFDNNINFWPARAKGDFSVSGNGMLVYQQGTQDNGSELVWIDRDGRTTKITSATTRYFASLSPDGSTIAFDELQKEEGNLDIWLIDIARGVRTRFTFNPGEDMLPVWKNKSEMIYFASHRNGTKNYELYAKQAGGTKEEERILGVVNQDIYPTASSPDGRYLLLTVDVPGNNWDLAYLDLQGDQKIVPILATKFTEGLGEFSPDGKWILYQSNESGRNEVYVRPFLKEGSQWQVSSGGGNPIGWSASGEIFFDSQGMLTSIRADISGAVPRFSSPTQLFRIGNETGIDIKSVTRDGKRFIASRTPLRAKKNLQSMIVNWQTMMQNR